MKDEHSVGKSKSLKSCKAAITGKQKIAIRIKKAIFFLLTEIMILIHIQMEIKPIQ